MTKVTDGAKALELRAQLDQHIATLRADLQKAEQDRDTLETQRSTILAEPVNAAALIARAHSSIDAVADNYLLKISASVGSSLKTAPTVADMLHSFGTGSASLYIPLRGSSSFLGDYNDEPLTQEAATFLFRDALKSAAEQAIRAASLHPETLAGIAMEDATKRLEKIDAKRKENAQKIDALRAAIAELNG